jgi:hypothetical protein
MPFDFPAGPLTVGQVYSPIPGVYYRWDGTSWLRYNVSTTGIGEAPADGKQYARKDTAWSEVVATGGGGGSSDWSDITNKPSTFPPSSHTHPIDQVTDLGGILVALNNTDIALTNDLATRATIASPTFTGDPKAPTPLAGDNDTSIATTAFVTAAVATGVSTKADSASPVFTGDPKAPTPSTIDNDTSIATTAFVKNQGYATLASPTFTGDPKAPTPAVGDNDTSVATTAFVKSQGYLTDAVSDGNQYARQNGTWTVVTGGGGGGSADWADITNKPATFPPTLPIAQTGVTNLVVDLAAKEPLVTAGTTTDYYKGNKTWAPLNKAAVGLSNVDNTADTAKPVSTAQAAAIATKEPIVAVGTTGDYYRGDKTWVALNKAAVGLGNVDNTSDASKPVSTAQAAAIATKEPIVAAGTVTDYYKGNKTWATLDKAAVGLANVDNTSDANKPVSTAQAAAIGAKIGEAPNDGQQYARQSLGWAVVTGGGGGGTGVTDGDKGDIVVSGTGATWMLDAAVVTPAAKTVLDDTSIAAMQVTLGVEPALPAGGNTTHYLRGDKTWVTLPAGQAADATLTALAGLDATPGLVEQTSADVFTKRAIGVGTSVSVITRADGDTRYAAASHTHTAAQVTDFAEAVDDRVGALLVAGTNITLSYNDVGNQLTINGASGGTSTTSISDTPPPGPSAGQLWWDSNSGDLLIYYNDGNTSQWISTNGVSTGSYLPTIGGTLTGDLTINKASPSLYLNKATVSDWATIQSSMAGNLNWVMTLGDGTAAADFTLTSYDDAGVYRSTPLRVDRFNGYMTVNGGSQATIEARAQYQAAMKITSDSADGKLTMKTAFDAVVEFDINSLFNKAIIRSKRATKSRWEMQLGDGMYEGGGNAGNDFLINRFDDAGTMIDTALKITRSTSTLTSTGGIVAAGTVTSMGYTGRAGISGAFAPSTNNFCWVVPGAMEMWVDATKIGTVNTTCDYRTKKDVEDLGSTWDQVKALRPISYTQAEFSPPSHIDVTKDAQEPLFPASDVPQWGFIAHELQETLLPSAATGVKDAENEIQGPNLMAIIAALTKTVQECQARIEQLEAANGV